MAACVSLLLADCGGASSPSPQTVYNVGGVVSGVTGSGLVLQNNGGDDLSVSANGPFVFAKPLAANTAYSVTVHQQPSDPAANCIVMNAGRAGVVLDSDVTAVLVVCAQVAKFAYVTYLDSASGPAAVVLKIDPESGSLTLVPGSATPTNGAPLLPVPGGHYAYAQAGAGIAGFAIDDASGGLAALAGSPFGVGVVPGYDACVLPGNCLDPVPTVTQLAVDPTGQRLYAYYEQHGPCCPSIPVVSSIIAFVIDQATGTLTPLTLPAAPGGNPTTAMAIDPQGRFLYLANADNVHIEDPGGVRHYLIDATSGALSGSSIDAAVSWPASIAFEPGGNFAYVVDPGLGAAQGLSAAQGLAIEPASGVLTNIGPEVVVPGLSTLVVDPAGSFASGGCTGGLCTFSLDPIQGLLTALPGSPFPTGASPSSLVFDPSGKFALDICAAAICVYTLDSATGVPKLAPASPFTITGIVPQSIVVTPGNAKTS